VTGKAGRAFRRHLRIVDVTLSNCINSICAASMCDPYKPFPLTATSAKAGASSRTNWENSSACFPHETRWDHWYQGRRTPSIKTFIRSQRAVQTRPDSLRDHVYKMNTSDAQAHATRGGRDVGTIEFDRAEASRFGVCAMIPQVASSAGRRSRLTQAYG